MLLGSPHVPRGLDRFRDALPVRLVRALEGIDVRIVADRALRDDPEEQETAW